jgi:AraC-like DNA-binding protein
MKTSFERILPDDGSSFKVNYMLDHDPKQFEWSYHYHTEIELVCVAQGSGRCHVGNHLSYFKEGQLVLIGSNVPHGGFGFGAIDTFEQLYVQFLPNFLGDTFFESKEMEKVKLLLERSQQGICFYGDTQKRVEELLKTMVAQQPFERMITLLTIFQTLALSSEYTLLNAFGTTYEFNSKDQKRLAKVYTFVEKNYNQEVDIQLIAEEVGLTVPAFCTYFKKNLNQTFTDFVNEYRVNKACILLLEGKPVADVCFETGFNNVSYFGKVFKSLKHESPSSFSKKHGYTKVA